MASIEEDFPRGGPAKESKQLPQQTEVDNLFQSHEPTVTKKRKGAKQDVDKTFKKQKTASDTARKLGVPATHVDILHMRKNVKAGMLMLGCVKEVTDFEVVVSLPGGMTGYININRVSDSYTKLLTEQLDSEDTEEIFSFPHLFRPGMLFRCVVERVDTAKSGMGSIQLSINPKMVNKALSSSFLKSGMMLSGCVESVEDHGFIIDLGINGTNGFLPKPAVKNKSNNPEELKVGQYITCVLEDVKSEGRVVRLSVDSSTASPACADPEHGWTLNNLLPGLMVNAQIKTVTKHGLILEFLSVFTGQVDFLHMERSMASSYTRGDNVTACVLYVDTTTRAVGLSLRSHLLKPGGGVELPATDRIGEVVHDCRVSAIHHMSGAFLELPDQTVVFVHRRNLKEPHQTSSMNKILAKPELSCRIVDFNVLEQIHFVTLRKSVIELPFFRLQDLTAGQIVEATVLNLQSSGMIVRLTEQIKGFVPKTHLSDVILRNPEKKYVPGMKIKCRVLSVDLERKKLILTRKKAMVESTLPLLLTLTDARRGRVSHGCIVNVKHFGCIVRFYNNVTGLLPAEELCSEGYANPEELYSIGQVVKVKVLRCDLVNERMVLSIKAVGEEICAPVPQFDFEIGKKVEARVLGKTPGGVVVSILPDEVRALLPTSHLSDHTSNCPLLWDGLQEGDTISNLFLLSKKKESIILTKKPLLKWSLEDGTVAKDFSDITVGMQLVGWVKSIMPYGIFVEFPNGLSGLAPKAAISDKFLSDIAALFQLGQTVFAKVTNLDEEKRRFLVSLKPSDTVPPEGDAQARLIRGLQERRAVADMLTSRGDSELLQQLFALSVGQKLKLTVDQLNEEEGRIFRSDELTEAMFVASKQHVMGRELTEGQKVNAVILYVDFVTTAVHVSILPKLVETKKTLEEGWTYKACYEFVDKDFAVISLGKTGHLTVIQTTSHLNETFRSEMEKPSPTNTLTVTVSDSGCDELEGLPLVVWDGTVEKSKRAPAESKSPLNLKGFSYGQFVRGTVKSVKPTCVTVTLEGGTVASVHVSEVMEEVRAGTFPTAKLQSGSEVTARVIGVREVRSHRYLPISHANLTYGVPELTLKPSKLDENVELPPLNIEDKLSDYQAGQTVTCFVAKFNREKNSLVVTIGPSVTGTVELLNMITDPNEAQKTQKLYQLGKALKAIVVGLSPCKQYLNLSLNGVYKLEKGMVTMGMMLTIRPSGLVLKLPGCVVGTVSVVDMADAYKPNPLRMFSKNKVVRCFLLEKQNDQWLLSLRPSRLNSVSTVVKDTEVLSIEDLKEGQVIRGYLSSVEEDGVFVRLSRSIVGRAEFSQATKYLVPRHAVFGKNVPSNTLLTTKILSIDKQKTHVSLSLLHEDTGKPDPLPESLRLRLRLPGEKYKPVTKRKQPESESQEGQELAAAVWKNKPKRTKTEDSDSGVEVGSTERTEPAKVKRAPAARLQVSAGFCWDAGLSDLKPAPAALAGDSSDGEDEEDTGAKVPKKSRHEKEMEKQQAEKALIKKEVELMDPGLRPQDAASFERLLLASPDSSLLWLQYMAFHLQATQIEQARSVAERALKTICFREEQEKLNVWVALLNLENLYGTEESLKKVFERAQQFSEPMPVYQQLADIYAKSEKTQKAENLYKTMVKRFRQNRAVWLSYGTFLLMQGQGDAASALLQRALKSLHTKEHVDVIAKFAQLEFRYGDVEKGKSMLDKILTSYPKRTDLWSVFIDLMVKHGSQKDVRALFDRVIHLSLAVKKIKFFFKRYLEYEKKSGTAESIQAVKEKALEYVEAKGTGAAC